MTDTQFKKLFQPTQQVKLTTGEKSWLYLKVRLAGRLTASPFFAPLALVPKPALVLTLLLLFFMATTGLTYAAARSNPGDLLYPMRDLAQRILPVSQLEPVVAEPIQNETVEKVEQNMLVDQVESNESENRGSDSHSLPQPTNINNDEIIPDNKSNGSSLVPNSVSPEINIPVVSAETPAVSVETGGDQVEVTVPAVDLKLDVKVTPPVINLPGF